MTDPEADIVTRASRKGRAAPRPKGTKSSPTPEPTSIVQNAQKAGIMSDYNASLAEAMSIEGAMAVALVDSKSGMALATQGAPAGLDLDIAAAGNSNVVQAKLRTMSDLGLKETIEDILITLGTQYHIIRPVVGQDGLFLYLVLDKARANLAMARFRLTSVEKAFSF